MEQKRIGLSTALTLFVTVAALLAATAVWLGVGVRVAHPVTAIVYGACAVLLLAGFGWSAWRGRGEAQPWRVGCSLTLATVFAVFALWNGYFHPVLNLIFLPIAASGGLVLAVWCTQELLGKAFSVYPFWLLVGAVGGAGFVTQYVVSGMTLSALAIPSAPFLIANMAMLVPVCTVFAFMSSRKKDGVDWVTGVLFCVFVAVCLVVTLFGGHFAALWLILTLCVAAMLGGACVLSAFAAIRRKPGVWVALIALGVILATVMIGACGVLPFLLPKLFFIVIYAALTLFSLVLALLAVKEAKPEEFGIVILFFVAVLLFGGCILFGGYFSPLWSVLVPAVSLAVAAAFVFWVFEWYNRVLPWNFVILLEAAIVLNGGLMTGLFEHRLPMIGMMILYGLGALLGFIGAVPGAIAATGMGEGDLDCDDRAGAPLACAVCLVILAPMLLFGGYIPGWWNVIPGIVAGFVGFMALGGCVGSFEG